MECVSGLEAVNRDYAPKGVKFFYIYKSLAHPELIGNYVQPFTFNERLAHARQAINELDTAIPWLVDPMDNRLKHALGNKPNSEFVIDPEGKVVRKRVRSSPDEVRKDLEKLVGKVDRVTKPEELKRKVQPPLALSAAMGKVDRVPRTGMYPLVMQPELENEKEPFFAKLRAEATIEVVDEGKGKVYFGFHLDPFHHAHWNNLTKPLRFELELPEGVKFAAKTGEAPKAVAESDSDPREFLLDVDSWPSDKKVLLSVTYAACTEDECHIVTQHYVLSRQRDLDGGRAAGAGAGFRFLGTEEIVKKLMADDKDGDGKLIKEELNSLQKPRFATYDLNRDGVLDKEEVLRMAVELTSSADSRD